MHRRKEINNEYKARRLNGGVYTITNMVNGKYLIGYAANLKSIQSRFQFAATTGSAVHPKLQADWDKYGAQAFTFSVLEELEQKSEQSQAEFMDELKTLEQLCRMNLDESKEYSCNLMSDPLTQLIPFSLFMRCKQLVTFFSRLLDGQAVCFW